MYRMQFWEIFLKDCIESLRMLYVKFCFFLLLLQNCILRMKKEIETLRVDFIYLFSIVNKLFLLYNPLCFIYFQRFIREQD